MRTFEKEMNVKQIENTLSAAANYWSEFLGCQWISNDMKKSIDEWKEDCTLKSGEIFSERWFAIREQGVEYGCKEVVKLRLLKLETPVQVIKIVGDGEQLATVRVRIG